MEETDLTTGSAPRYSFDSIPNELIEYHIFGYFLLHYWTQHFVSVCKRWKQICEHSTITPKYLRITVKPCTIMDIGRAILYVKKYQPTILEVNFYGRNSVCGYSLEEVDGVLKRVDVMQSSNQIYGGYTIHELVGASERIDTLIVNNDDLLTEGITPSKALSRITTLVWRAKFSKRIFKVFPALKRLQIHESNDTFIFRGKDSPATKYPVEELTVMNSNNVEFYLHNVEVPKVTLVTGNKVFKKIDGFITELHMPDLSYEEYFRYFGKTKFYVMLSKLNLPAATKLLETSTSYEYEADLIERHHIGYTYPTNLDSIRNYDAVILNDYYRKNPHELLFSNKLPVSDSVRFEYFVNKGEVEAAVDILAKSGATIINHRNSDRIISAFFKLLSYPQLDTNALTDKNVREVATAMTKREIETRYGSLFLKTLHQFEKIVELGDWSKTTAVIDDYDLFWAMIERGAQIPYKNFYENLLNHNVTVILKILRKLSEREPSIWYDILSERPQDALAIMERHGISPMIEKNGRALWYGWLQNKNSFSNDVLLLYKDHMDSYGSTLLITAIEGFYDSIIERLLKKGADPNLHQQGKLSPLSTLLVTSVKSNRVYNNLILLLFKSGADVNLACTFEGRQCSPLMIAVLVGSPLPTISLLIALGARTDYCDDQGRSIVDCVVECESKYGASDYRTLKWLLNGSK